MQSHLLFGESCFLRANEITTKLAVFFFYTWCAQAIDIWPSVILQVDYRIHGPVERVQERPLKFKQTLTINCSDVQAHSDMLNVILNTDTTKGLLVLYS